MRKASPNSICITLEETFSTDSIPRHPAQPLDVRAGGPLRV